MPDSSSEVERGECLHENPRIRRSTSGEPAKLHDLINPRPDRLTFRRRHPPPRACGRGWTQRDLAEIVGRPPRPSARFRRGHEAHHRETALELAAALGTSAEVWMRLDASDWLRIAEERLELAAAVLIGDAAGRGTADLQRSLHQIGHAVWPSRPVRAKAASLAERGVRGAQPREDGGASAEDRLELHNGAVDLHEARLQGNAGRAPEHRLVVLAGRAGEGGERHVEVPGEPAGVDAAARGL